MSGVPVISRQAVGSRLVWRRLQSLYNVRARANCGARQILRRMESRRFQVVCRLQAMKICLNGLAWNGYVTTSSKASS